MPIYIDASVKLSPEFYSRIKSLANLRKQSLQAIMCQALESYVTREDKREAWRKEGI